MRATASKVIVKFLPYKRAGVIVIPDKHQPESTEAVIEHDPENEWERGAHVAVSTMDGTYFEVAGERYCTVKRESIYLTYTPDGDEVRDPKPAGRMVLVTDEDPVKEMGGLEIPSAFWRYKGEGQVTATGPGIWDYPDGAWIFFDRSKAVRMKIDGKPVLLVREADVHAMREEAAELDAAFSCARDSWKTGGITMVGA